MPIGIKMTYGAQAVTRSHMSATARFPFLIRIDSNHRQIYRYDNSRKMTYKYSRRGEIEFLDQLVKRGTQ